MLVVFLPRVLLVLTCQSEADAEGMSILNLPALRLSARMAERWLIRLRFDH